MLTPSNFSEASFEYGLVTAFKFGVATGTGRITAGVYIRIGGRQAVISGFFNASGNADVAGLITISANFRVQIWYDAGSGRVAGAATFSVSFKICLAEFSYSIGVAYARQGESAQGKNGSNDSRTVAGWNHDLALSDAIVLPPPEFSDAAIAAQKNEIASKIEPDRGKQDVSYTLLQPAIWGRYWSAFEESLNECERTL